MPLTRRVIACLDVNKGRVPRGERPAWMPDPTDPVAVARYYVDEGADELFILDITSSAERRDMMAEVVHQIAHEIFIPLTVGGGIRSIQDMQRMLNAGADKVALNTAAVREPGIVAEAAARLGSQCVVVAVDVRRSGRNPGDPHWVVCTHGGRKPTQIDALEWMEALAIAGVGEILLTSADQDGTGEGFDLELLRAAVGRVDVPVIASGGAGKPADLAEAITEGGADAVLATTLFHSLEHAIPDAKAHLAAAGIPVRR